MLVYANHLRVQGAEAEWAVSKAVGGWLKEQLGFGLRPDQLKQDGEYNGQRRGIPVDQPRLVAQRGPCDGEQGARAATRQTACTCIRDLRPAHACAYHFFRVISLSTSISRSRSATIFFSRPFSCSSCRSRFTSAGSNVPKCFRQA